jgi:hypothetical protein
MKPHRLLLSFLLGLLIASCTSKQGHNKNSDASQLTKKEYYQLKMQEKNFRLTINGPCDDAFEDTIHERSVVYFDHKIMSEENATVEFKFIESCCQAFLGDYTIENDTLRLQLEQVNNEVCLCLCWYRYKLIINEPKAFYKDIVIEVK